MNRMQSIISGIKNGFKVGYNVFKHYLNPDDLNWCVVAVHENVYGSHSIVLALRETLKQTFDELANGGYEPKSIEKSINEIARCTAALDRLIEDDYCKELSDQLEEQFGKLQLIEKGKTEDQLVEVEVKREKETEENTEQVSQLEDKLWETQQQLFKQDLNLVTRLLRNYRKW